MDTAYQKLEALKRDEEKRRKDIKKLQADIEASETELKKPPPETEDPSVIKAEEVNLFACCAFAFDMVLIKLGDLSCRIKRRMTNGSLASNMVIWKGTSRFISINAPRLLRSFEMPKKGTEASIPLPLHSPFVSEYRIRSFANADTIKLQNMFRWHKDTHDAILWLRSHRNLFKMEVFEPPYMCMTVPDSRHQDGVEALINSAQLRVCDRLMEIFKLRRY